MRITLNKTRQTRGMTLVELTIAILILTIATIAALRASESAQQAVTGETARLLARLAARNHLELIQISHPNDPLPQQVTLGPHRFSLTQETRETAAGLRQVTVTARAQSGEGAQLVAYFPPATSTAPAQ